MATPTINKSLRFPPELHDQIKEFAELNRLSFNGALMYLAEQGLIVVSKKD